MKAYWEAIAATDFFTVEVLTARGLIRYFVLFVIDLETRPAEIAGIVHQPYDDCRLHESLVCLGDRNAQQFALAPPDLEIRIVVAPVFLATKWAAFVGWGGAA